MKMRYTLYYWVETKGIIPYKKLEKIPFKTLKEAQKYLAITSEEDNAYILDNVTGNEIRL